VIGILVLQWADPGADLQLLLMQSASVPKRIQLVGSDGARYRFLAKPHDDLRRDLRVMEFAMLLNRLLEEDASTRGRSMQLQTFMCTPLGDQGGLVEWVLHTQTFQGILRTTYAVHHHSLENINPGVHKASWESAYRQTHAEKSQDPQALCKWMKQRLAKVPAIMHKWWLAKYASSC
jgi:phosphatidylinositol kinase/protein kinase (PI-3  family)